MKKFDFAKFNNWLTHLSGKWIMVSVGSSFALATVVSMFIAQSLIPKKVSQSRKAGLGVSENFEQASKSLDSKQEETILKRNIFNSEGKLGDVVDEPKKEEVVDQVTDEAVKSDLPLKLKGVIFAGDPKNGLALIENTRKRRLDSYLVGDWVIQGKATLVEVYEEKVHLDRGGRLEYIELERQELVRSKRQKSIKKSAGLPKIARIASDPVPDAYKEEGFERNGHEITLNEDYRRNLLSPNQLTKVLQDAKAEPNIVGNELRGFRLTRIREDSIYRKAGLQNDDIIEEINGIPLRDAAGAIRLLQQLKGEREIEARVNRGGSSFNINILVQ